ncbi:DUF1214 domain-containing protein [Nitrosococcus watsonii]|uniref:DUF1254 domain-containing protein n=1 Tax=Nitrosococcus watsoni (strain C-113) TaxID=105559 RepID=D8KBC8_NITWC|nr:DUF1214 domain-containing protein [Nitrosococcus watsonii]ADJ29575.1 protein of unknown function DUF1214 [Nitrosococcus watsonii C-113]
MLILVSSLGLAAAVAGNQSGASGPNPAAVFCAYQGGEYLLASGECRLKDGAVVDAWTHYREHHQDQTDSVPLANATLQGDEVIQTPIGNIELIDSYFDDDASRRLFDQMDYQRAAQSYIWSTPLVSITTWRDNQGKAFGVENATDFVVLKSLKEKRGIVTGNLTTPYIFNFISLEAGAVQIEYPAGKTAGAVLDFWQRPVFDLGLTGPDKGKGGTYIVVGPEDNLEKYKQDGVNVYQSATNNILIGLRILGQDPGYFGKFTAAYKMGRVGEDLAPSNFITGKDVEWSATAPRGLEYWKKLSAIINEEPVREIDKPWMAMLKPLGIVKGQEFNPDERQQAILMNAAAMGELMTRNLQTNPRYTEPYWKGTHWYKSFDFHPEQETDTIQEIDQRGTWFYEAVSSTKGMLDPQPGSGQVYMTAKRDSDGNLLRADRNYKLHVPKDVPVKQFWSLTLYSENTRRPYDNGGTEISDVSLGSRTEGLKVNDDGSIDLFVGPETPKGFESNHLKTVDNDGWFVYFRLYAPEQAFFDKTFKLGDFKIVE